MRERALGLAIAAALALSPGAAAASPSPAPGPSGGGGGLTTKDYQIETDATQSNFGTGDFTMPHKVRFFRPGTDATGDRAQGNFKNGMVTLIGNVVVHDSGNAAKGVGGNEAYGGSGPATLTCDRLEVDSHRKLYTAIGNVHFSQGDRRGSAQRGVLDRGRGTLQLTGDVNVADGTSSLTANSVDDNLQSKDVVVSGSPAVLKQGGANGEDSVETADLRYNSGSGDFSMPGKATFRRPGTDAVGDRASGNTKRGTLLLEGNVVVHDSGNAPEAGPQGAYGGHGPATLTCDTLDVDTKQRRYHASGKVHFSQGPDSGSADDATLDRASNVLAMRGAVKLTEGPSTMTAGSLDYNLQTKDVKVVGAPIVIRQPVPSAAPGTPKPSPRPKKK